MQRAIFWFLVFSMFCEFEILILKFPIKEKFLTDNFYQMLLAWCKSGTGLVKCTEEKKCQTLSFCSVPKKLQNLEVLFDLKIQL